MNPSYEHGCILKLSGLEDGQNNIKSVKYPTKNAGSGM